MPLSLALALLAAHAALGTPIATAAADGFCAESLSHSFLRTPDAIALAPRASGPAGDAARASAFYSDLLAVPDDALRLTVSSAVCRPATPDADPCLGASSAAGAVQARTALGPGRYAAALQPPQASGVVVEMAVGTTAALRVFRKNFSEPWQAELEAAPAPPVAVVHPAGSPADAPHEYVLEISAGSVVARVDGALLAEVGRDDAAVEGELAISVFAAGDQARYGVADLGPDGHVDAVAKRLAFAAPDTGAPCDSVQSLCPDTFRDPLTCPSFQYSISVGLPHRDYDNTWVSENLLWPSSGSEGDDADSTLLVQATSDPCYLYPASECSTKAVSAGEYKVRSLSATGIYRAQIRAVSASGLVTAFGITADNHEHELALEILGVDPTVARLVYSLDTPSELDQFVQLPFDASAALHEYSVVWKQDAIEWRADGQLLAAQVVDGSSAYGHAFMNVHAPPKRDRSWAGSISNDGAWTRQAQFAAYERVPLVREEALCDDDLRGGEVGLVECVVEPPLPPSYSLLVFVGLICVMICSAAMFLRRRHTSNHRGLFGRIDEERSVSPVYGQRLDDFSGTDARYDMETDAETLERIRWIIERLGRPNTLAPAAPAPQPPAGISVEYLSRLPTHRYREGQAGGKTGASCIICLDEYEEGDEMRTLPCFHSFHAACVDEWLVRRSGVCPLCLHPVSE